MTTTISLQQQVYPASTQYGAPVPIPAAAASGTASALMVDADVLAGPPNQRTATLGLEFSYDGGRTFTQTPVVETFASGPTNLAMDSTTQAQPPLVAATIPTNPMPTHVRPFVSPNGPTNIGIAVSFSDSTGKQL